MTFRIGWLLPLLAVMLPLAAKADEARGTAVVIFENDIFYRADRDYTNGVEFSWTPPARGRETLPALVSESLPSFFDPEAVRASYSLGQLMFTPEHTNLIVPPPTERPYAGYLYGAVALDDFNNQLRLQVGMVGPASLAANSQKFVHAVRGLDMPQGWHAQLRDEPGLILAYQRTHEVTQMSGPLGSSLDIKVHLGGAAGNVFDYLNGGAVARLGFNLPHDNGPPQIGPARIGSYAFEPQGGFGAYLLAGLEGRLVGRNIFLDGNSFHASPSVARNVAVGDVSLGGAVAFEDFRIAFVHVLRSREYAGQKDFDQFGTLSLSTNF